MDIQKMRDFQDAESDRIFADLCRQGNPIRRFAVKHSSTLFWVFACCFAGIVLAYFSAPSSDKWDEILMLSAVLLLASFLWVAILAGSVERDCRWYKMPFVPFQYEYYTCRGYYVGEFEEEHPDIILLVEVNDYSQTRFLLVHDRKTGIDDYIDWWESPARVR